MTPTFPTRRASVLGAAHPVPDQAGLDAARRILRMVQGLGPEDLVLCLISGGGSALLSLPAPGITLEEKQAVNKALLRPGAAIDEKHGRASCSERVCQSGSISVGSVQLKKTNNDT